MASLKDQRRPKAFQCVQQIKCQRLLKSCPFFSCLPILTLCSLSALCLFPCRLLRGVELGSKQRTVRRRMRLIKATQRETISGCCITSYHHSNAISLRFGRGSHWPLRFRAFFPLSQNTRPHNAHSYVIMSLISFPMFCCSFFPLFAIDCNWEGEGHGVP